MNRPITVALVDDYDVVLLGVAKILDCYRDRVLMAEIDTNRPLQDTVDIVLYDSFAQPDPDHDDLAVLIASQRARKVVVYTWTFAPALIDIAMREGAHGYLSKALPAHDLVAALEAVHAGQQVVSDPPGRSHTLSELDWPGRDVGLTGRESEILALITQGLSNAEIVACTYLSANTVKAYIRSAYRRIEVSSRTKAMLWGIDHGFSPDHHRIDHWRDGPCLTGPD